MLKYSKITVCFVMEECGADKNWAQKNVNNKRSSLIIEYKNQEKMNDF